MHVEKWMTKDKDTFSIHLLEKRGTKKARNHCPYLKGINLWTLIHIDVNGKRDRTVKQLIAL